MSDGRTYGEVFHGEWAAAQRRFMHKPPAWDDLTPTEQASTQAGALAVAEDVQRRGFAGVGEYPNGSGSAFLGTTADLDGSAPEPPERYALVEQMGFRRTYGTIREIEFVGKPMAEVTPLDGSGVRMVAPESLYQVTWLTREQAERATRTGAHSAAAIDAPRARSHVNLSGADPFGAWADDDDADPNEGKDDGMSTAEREEYDRDAEFRLDAAQEARDLEREAEADL